MTQNKSLGLTVAQNSFYLAILIINMYIITVVVRQLGGDYFFRKSLSSDYNLKEKIDLQKQAIALNPDKPKYYDVIAILFTKLAEQQNQPSKSTQLNLYERALENFENSIALNPINYKAQLHLASVQYRISKNLGQFIETVRKIKNLDPHNKAIAKHNEKWLELGL